MLSTAGGIGNGLSVATIVGTLPERALRRLEVRAFGCLLEELLQRCAPSDGVDQQAALWQLHGQCMAPRNEQRPDFAEIVVQLDSPLLRG